MKAPLYSFDGDVVIVTGAARGQGLSHAIALAKAGARVIGIDKVSHCRGHLQYSLASREELESAREALGAISSENTLVECDLTKREERAQAIELISCRYGNIDAIVHNAGVNVVKDFAQTTPEEWDTVHDINLRSPFFFTQGLVSYFRASGGSIVVISSLAALKTVQRQIAYSTSKAAVLALVRGLAAELGPMGIRVNAICPSLVVSPQAIGLTKVTKQTGASGLITTFGVLPNVGTLRPHDVTELVLWLVSDGSRCMTGQALVLDAGRSL